MVAAQEEWPGDDLIYSFRKPAQSAIHRYVASEGPCICFSVSTIRGHAMKEQWKAALCPYGAHDHSVASNMFQIDSLFSDAPS